MQREGDDLTVTPFEDLGVTTMTLVVLLKGEVRIDVAFNLMYVTRLDLPPPRRSAQKFKIPNINMPGAAVSMRHGDQQRLLPQLHHHRHIDEREEHLGQAQPREDPYLWR